MMACLAALVNKQCVHEHIWLDDSNWCLNCF